MIIFFLFTVLYVNASSIDKGISLFEKEKYKEATALFEKLVEKNENDADAHFWLSRSQLQLNKVDEALESIETAIELNSNAAEYHFRHAQVLGAQIAAASVFRQPFIAGDMLEAYERTVELDPRHIGGHVGLANFYLRAPSIMGGDTEKAKEEIAILNKLGSKQGQLIWIGILVEEEKFKQAEEAYDDYHKNFDDSKDNPAFYNGYGYFLLQQNKPEKAIEMFKRQALLLPEEANPYDSLGDGYRAAGKLQEALVSYKKAVEINPGFEASKKNIEELEEELDR